MCGVHFFSYRPEKPFLGKSGQKIKIVIVCLNLVPRLIWICGIQWCSLFLFLTINIFLGQIWSKNSKLFKGKFDTKTNLNMQNAVAVSILSVLECFYLILQKYSNVCWCFYWMGCLILLGFDVLCRLFGTQNNTASLHSI